MASSLPIPAPPRTPTPPTPIPEGDETAVLGTQDAHRTVQSTITYDPNALSPTADGFPISARFGSMNSSMNSPAMSENGLGPPPPGGGRNPFNFQTQTIKEAPVIAKSVCQSPFACIPSSNVQSSPSPSLQENVWYSAQSTPQISHHAADDKNDDCVSPLLSEQAGNTFGRSKGKGLRISTNYKQMLDVPHQADDEPITRRRKELYSNLTPSTPDFPYTFQKPNPNKQNIGQRRGHRYKHSSVSTQHQIFLEPTPRAPLALPASLPIPTVKEAWTSMSRDQTTRLFWCLCHITVSGVVLYSAANSLALTALSHLVFFDAISATICVAVDIFHNFEVWKRSSIRHPFGLERAEVLGGFAMSIFLLFMGFDLMSHNIKHFLESAGSHEPHHPHSHKQRVTPGSVDFAALTSIIATLISAIGLKNHARIAKAMRFAYISYLPSVLSNPSHFLTLTCSTFMLMLPLLSITMFAWLDRILCTIIAVSMFALGFRLAMAQGLMLLMSYSGTGVSEVMREIANEPAVTGIEEARFWQVHYGLCMANLKLRVKGGGGPAEDQAMGKLRDRICLLVRNRLGGGYGKGEGLKWEVTVQFSTDGIS